MKNRKKWSEQDKRYLIQNRSTKTNEELSKELNKSKHSICCMSTLLGLEYEREDRSAPEESPKRITDPYKRRKMFALSKGFKNVAECVRSYKNSRDFIIAYKDYRLREMEVVID